MNPLVLLAIIVVLVIALNLIDLSVCTRARKHPPTTVGDRQGDTRE